MLIMMAGLPGTGKSALARAVAKRTSAFVLDKDYVRAALFPAEMVEYSREQDDFVLRIMLKVAGWMLRKDAARPVILDGRPFSKKYQVDMVINFAEWTKSPWSIIECTCSEDTAKKRIETGAEHPAADRTLELYQRVKDGWEEIARPKLVLDTELPLAQNMEKAVAYIGRAGESKEAAKTEL
jgi:adenylylsulfate kinase